jgi:peptide-methionine (S)-S-oxide reductase
MRILMLFFAALAVYSMPSVAQTKDTKQELILGGGCFWCMEAIFKRIEGVQSVESGYCGGKKEHPTYEEVGSGTTDHAEVIKITYLPEKVSRHTLLTVFFHLHDPTQKNRQGADIGTQYRSVIFYASDEEKKESEGFIKEIDQSKLWNSPIVTTIEKELNYTKAEEYHQNYYDSQPNQPYCSFVIGPKIKKLKEKFPNLLKPAS